MSITIFTGICDPTKPKTTIYKTNTRVSHFLCNSKSFKKQLQLLLISLLWFFYYCLLLPTNQIEVKVAQSYLTVCNPMDYTVHGILQARILKWVAFPFSRGSSQSRDWTQVSHITGRFFNSWAIGKPKNTGVRCPRILEWVVYPFSSESSQPSNQTGVSCIPGRLFTNWAIREMKCRVICKPCKVKGQSNQRWCWIIYLTTF